MASASYRCSICGAWVNYDQIHTCQPQQFQWSSSWPSYTSDTLLAQVAAALERLAASAERIEAILREGGMNVPDKP